MNPSAEDPQASVEMPRYQSHKKVWALQINTVAQSDFSDELKPPRYLLTFADEGYGPRWVDGKVVQRYMPVQGDYFVVYDDGYESISPQKAFEDGYTRI